MKKLNISLYINILITILTIISMIIMFTGYKFMDEPELILESSHIGMFKFFTVDSNLLMGITSFIYAYYLLHHKNINYKLSLLKLLSTTAVSLTFIVVFVYLGPISPYGIKAMLLNSNLFFHLIIPVLSIISFIFFEEHKLKIKDALYGIIPTLIYSIYYLLNVLFHMEKGVVDPKYDWYWFAQNGTLGIIIVIVVIYLFSYILSLILYLFNKKIHKNV